MLYNHQEIKKGLISESMGLSTFIAILFVIWESLNLISFSCGNYKWSRLLGEEEEEGGNVLVVGLQEKYGEDDGHGL